MRMDTQLQGITDLTLLTPIKPGFVESFEPITYAARLRAVLKTLNSLRLASRESTDPPSPFTDVVTRFRIVHSFRWAVIDPAPGSTEPARLLLNVCFDGGWEPYMRVIWRDLGTLLDLILCHSVDYKLSRNVSFESYAAWVRANEVPADFLFIESGRSVSDQEYLEKVEAEQREKGGREVEVTRLRTAPAGDFKPLPGDGSPEATRMALAGLNAVGAMYTLSRYFTPAPALDNDGWCLQRAARDVLFELIKLDTRKIFPPQHPVRQAFYPALNWFEQEPQEPVLKPRELHYEPGLIQGGMLTGYPALVGGAMLMIAVLDAPKALAWLAALPVTRESESLAEAHPFCNVGLSLSGLTVLGANPALLARLPQAFLEGMEQRAGVLGDLRHNHPQHWKLPQTPDGRRIDMSSVHIVLQLRWRKSGEAAASAMIKDISPARDGVMVLCNQAMRRNVVADKTTEAFGFVDGVSQPAVDAKPGSDWTDAVPRGELLLGYPTSRDKVAVPEARNDLLDNGTFLVIRKLRQHVDRLHDRLVAQSKELGISKDELMAKMMGRGHGGTALAKPGATGNDFNYVDDAEGRRCPFHAHIRRANPRDHLDGQQVPMPRLLRRGMSYGEQGDAERGLIFMAYNASLSEQFEVVQRWIAGANGSGGFSGQPDPFMGVAVKGKPRIYRFEHNDKAVHLNLGDEPFVELQWGAYFFVPAIAALKNLGSLLKAAPPAAPPAPLRLAEISFPPAPNDTRGWQVWLENRDTTDAAWAHVRSQPGGVLRTAYGVLAGSHEAVDEVLENALGHYSVSGYAQRMKNSIGVGYLGLDADNGHDQQAPTINAAIEKISEQEGFEAAYKLSQGVLAQLKMNAHDLQVPEVPLDFEQIGSAVLAHLCTKWFGLPDGKHMWGTEFHAQDDPSRRCPVGFYAISRHVFGSHPSPIVSGMGQAAGMSLREQTRLWLAEQTDLSAWPLTEAIVAATRPLEKDDPGIVERSVAGIMLGFPPTMFGNLVTGLALLAGTKQLWMLQLVWTPGAAPFEAAKAMLRSALEKTIVARPVPASVWRVATQHTQLRGVPVAAGETVVVGLTSATHDGENHFTAFGGHRPATLPAGHGRAPLHACPGYAMSMGVLQGVLAAVLEAGTLRPTPSPTVLSLQL